MTRWLPGPALRGRLSSAAIESTMDLSAPDVILLGAEWPERALLRAELIEHGYNVVAIDAWPIPRAYRRPAMKPHMILVDLKGLAEPRQILDEMRLVLPPERALVVTALGTLPIEEIRQLGYHVVARPTSIRAIVAAAAGLLRQGDRRAARLGRQRFPQHEQEENHRD